MSEVARYFGYSKGAISKWCKKAPSGGTYLIPTESSRPHHHPEELSNNKIEMIIEYKKRYNRCAEVIHRHLLNDGVKVSLSKLC